MDIGKLHVVALFADVNTHTLLCELSDGRVTLYNTLGYTVSHREPWASFVREAVAR